MTGQDDWDGHWEQYADSAGSNPAQQFRRELVIDRLAAPPRARILDIGSGQGDLAALLSSEIPDTEIVGLELSASGVKFAAAKVPTADFVQVDLLARDARVERYSHWATHVTCSEVLEHVDDPIRLLSAGLRHAAPGARVVVTVPGGPRTAFDKYIGHRRHYGRKALRQLLEDSGLEVERCDAAGFPFFNLYRLAVLACGKRVIVDERHGSRNAAGSKVLAIFGVLFKANLRRGPLGWQIVAVGRVPID